MLQKGFAVHQLWHFDLFCTKHFEIQTRVLSGFETGLHAFVQTVSSCFIIRICNRHNFKCSVVKIRRKDKKKRRDLEISFPDNAWGFLRLSTSQCMNFILVSLLPLAAEVDSSVSGAKSLTAWPGQRSFYSQGSCLKSLSLLGKTIVRQY